MDDFGWSGRGSKCMMWCSRLDIVIRAVENSVGKISLIQSIIHGTHIDKKPNHCFPTITIDLDTSNGWFWMVWKGIQVHDVMQQAGYCAQGSGKFSSCKTSLLHHYPWNLLTKMPDHCFPTITIDLDTSNGWFWMVWKGIQVHDVMQQAGYCDQGSGKFSWQDLTYSVHYPWNILTKSQTIASQPSQLI
jgi:hypothetical protein